MKDNDETDENAAAYATAEKAKQALLKIIDEKRLRDDPEILFMMVNAGLQLRARLYGRSEVDALLTVLARMLVDEVCGAGKEKAMAV